MSETCLPEVKPVRAQHVWRIRVWTLEIQDKKETQAVLFGQDFQKSFRAADGFLCPRGKCVVGTDFMKGWVSSPESETLLRFLCWVPKNEASQNTGSLSDLGQCAGDESLWRLTLQGLRKWKMPEGMKLSPQLCKLSRAFQALIYRLTGLAGSLNVIPAAISCTCVLYTATEVRSWISFQKPVTS